MTTRFHLTRREALKLLGSVAALPVLMAASPAVAADAVGRIIVLSDLHSAYERSAQLLAAVRGEIETHSVPHLIVINGDVFELGNVVATRSAGVIDWALLRGLAGLAPVVINIGNHEPDLTDDLSKFVAEATGIGITVVSNIVDARTGKPYAPATTQLTLGALPVNVVGVATAALNTYPKAIRETLTLPDPVAWATENLPAALEAEGLGLVLSHAGVVADRSILPLLRDGSLMIGGHDHLLLTHDEGKSRYVHTGSWSAVYSVAEIGADGAIAVTQVRVAEDQAGDAELAALIEATLAEHLTAEERAAIGTSAASLTLAETGRYVAATMAAAGGGDVGFIGHTTLGTGLAEGPVSLYAFNAVVRFDGDLVKAEVSADVLAEILARANQDGPRPLGELTGDFLYGAPADVAGKQSYVIVTNDWSATNQKSYFGREDLVFSPASEKKLKAVVVESLR